VYTIILGHEKSETTRIYPHLSEKLKHDFYRKMVGTSLNYDIIKIIKLR